MMEVLINNVRYVPAAEIKPLSDDRLSQAIQELVSIQYFGEQHKAIAQAFNVLEILAPEIAKLVSIDVNAAYHAVHPE